MQMLREQTKSIRFGIYAALLALSLVGAVRSVTALAVALWLVPLTIFATLFGWDFYRTVVARVGRLLSSHRNVLDQLNQIKTATLAQAGAIQKLQHSPSKITESYDILTTPLALDDKRGMSPRVLYVTSNGSGLGHVTRLLAIAAKSRLDSEFLSPSAAAWVIAESGYRVTQVESQSSSGLSWDQWNREFSHLLDQTLIAGNFSAIVFDGIHVFRGVRLQARRHSLPLIWVCRGLWKPDVDTTHVENWREVADAIIIPSEGKLVSPTASVPAAIDSGLVTDPIVFEGARKPLTRAEAKQQLLLDNTKRHVLIQLGSGALGSRQQLEEAAIKAVSKLGDKWEPVVLRSPLNSHGAQQAVDHALVRRAYPSAHLIRAFDFSIVSAGYNTIHENITLRHPALYIPDTNMITDDQQRRADLISKFGGGSVIYDKADLEVAVRAMSQPPTLVAQEHALAGLSSDDGAEAAASLIDDLATRGRRGLTAKTFLPKFFDRPDN